jgi:hypothetical protein
MDSYRYEDFDEHNMTCSIRDHGELEIRLSNAQPKAFDYLLSRYLRKKPSEVAKYYGLMHFISFFLNLINVYRLWVSYPKLGSFNFVFESEKPLHCRRLQNDGEVLYLLKKRL